MKIIAISGKARHGKDTVAEFLKEGLEGYGKSRVLIIHYADLLKFICSQYLGWDGKKNEDGRRLLQYYGTNFVREKKPDFWVDFVLNFLEIFNENFDYVIIPDCRFPNEIEKLKLYYSTTHIRVIRSNFDNALTLDQINHPSETALDDYEPDMYLYNDGDLIELRAVTRRVIHELMPNKI